MIASNMGHPPHNLSNMGHPPHNFANSPISTFNAILDGIYCFAIKL
jgi:hypothetical protein